MTLSNSPDPTQSTKLLHQVVQLIDEQFRFAKHTVIRIENDEMAR